MARGDEHKGADGTPGEAVFPADLVEVMRDLTSARAVPLPLADEPLGELVVAMFFASMRAEEHERFPIRVALMSRSDAQVSEAPAPQHGGVPFAFVRR